MKMEKMDKNNNSLEGRERMGKYVDYGILACRPVKIHASTSK